MQWLICWCRGDKSFWSSLNIIKECENTSFFWKGGRGRDSNRKHTYRPTAGLTEKLVRCSNSWSEPRLNKVTSKVRLILQIKLGVGTEYMTYMYSFPFGWVITKTILNSTAKYCMRLWMEYKVQKFKAKVRRIRLNVMSILLHRRCFVA